MTLAVLPARTLSAARDQFAAAFPRIDTVIGLACRTVPNSHRDDAVAEARANAWATWYSLLRRGKVRMAVGPAGIAFNATGMPRTAAGLWAVALRAAGQWTSVIPARSGSAGSA